MKRLADIGDRDSKIARSGRVDIDADLRLRFLVVGIEVYDARIGCRGCKDPVARGGERLVAGPRDHEAYRLPASATDGGSHGSIAADRRELAEHLVDLGHNLLRRFLALLPGLQKNDEGAGIEVVAGAESAGGALDHRAHRTIVGKLQQPPLCVEHVPIHFGKPCSFGR